MSPIKRLTPLVAAISLSVLASDMNYAYTPENNQQQGNQLVASSKQSIPQALIAAIRQDLGQHINQGSFSGYIFFVDLNSDGVDEAIVYPEIGRPCSNRSCSIFIYTKIGGIYRKISADEINRYSAIAGSRNSPSIGILPTRSRGWHDLATRSFDYDTRSEVWTRISYGSHGYSDIDTDVILPTPRRIVQASSGLYVDFNTLLIP